MDEGLINSIKKDIQTAPPEGATQQPAPSPSPSAPSETPLTIAPDFQQIPPGLSDDGTPGSTIGDVGRAIVGGARDALQNTIDTVRKADPTQLSDAELRTVGVDPQVVKDATTLPEVPRADETKMGGTAINVGRDLERFILGFIGAQKVLGGLGVATNTFKGAAAAGALGDFAVTGANDPRLVDLFDKAPALQGPVLDAMGGDDKLWERKLTASLEGIVFGSAIEGVVRIVRVLRGAVKAAQEGTPEAAQKVLQEAAPELEQALKEVEGWHEVRDLNSADHKRLPDELSGPWLDDVTNDNATALSKAREDRAAREKLEADYRGEHPDATQAELEGLVNVAIEHLQNEGKAPNAPLRPSPLNDNRQPAKLHQNFEVTPSGQLELFPEVVRREEALHDIQLQIKGDRWIDPMTGQEKLLPMSNRALQELLASAKYPNSPLHIDALTPETREELLRALSSDAEAARFFAPKTVRGRPFALDDTRRADFDAAMERSLTIPYATLKAENPGAAIEDTLSTFLNYRYMDSPDTVKATLDQMAEAMRPMVDKHLGGFPQTFERVTELADWLGARPETLTALLSQQARAAEFMPSLTVAAKTWIQSLARDITEISKAIDRGVATDTAKAELIRRQDILADLVGTLKAVQTSGARTTAAGRIRTADTLTGEEIATLLKEVGEDNFKLLSRKLSLTEGKPQAVISLLEPSFGQKVGGVANEYWINAVLSGIPTHVVNTVTGLRNTFLFPLYRAAGGALTGDMASVRVGLAQYSGLKSAVLDSLEMARRSLVSENAYVDAAFHQVERENLWIKADTFGLDGSDILGRGINALGTAIRMPSRFLTSEDEFLKQLNYRASVVAHAKEEAYQKGLSDTTMVSYFVDGEKKMISQVDEYVRDRMNEAFHPQLEHGLDKAALDDARRATFTRPLNEGGATTLGEMVQRGAAQHPFLRHFVFPFVRVPTNIFREMVYESPLALTRSKFWRDMKAGGEQRADAVGRAALGTLFWTGAGFMAAEGMITGQGPTDPNLQRQWRAAGNEPYSIRLPGMGPDGKDLFISYNRFDPTAGVLGIAADFAYISAHLDERTQDQVAMTLTLSLANNLNSRSYLRSLTDLMGVLKASKDPNGPTVIQNYFQSRAASYVPRIVSQMNPDDGLKDARGAVDAVLAKIPGLSAGLEPRRDNFGEAIVPAIGWPITAVNPFAVGISKDGPARKELAYWAESPVRAQFHMPAPGIDGRIDLRDAKNTQTRQSAYDRWLEILTEPRFNGKTAEERMNEFVSSEGYKAMKAKGVEDSIYPKAPAAEVLRDQLSEHYKLAQQMMLSEPGFEDLRGALNQYRVNKEAIPYGAAPPPNPTLQDLLKAK